MKPDRLGNFVKKTWVMIHDKSQAVYGAFETPGHAWSWARTCLKAERFNCYVTNGHKIIRLKKRNRQVEDALQRLLDDTKDAKSVEITRRRCNGNENGNEHKCRFVRYEVEIYLKEMR